MGHLSGGYGVYGNLQKRLDRFMIGAPASREIIAILELLYTEQEAFVAARMPIKFSTLSRISKLTGINMEELLPILEGMAGKGLVMDFTRKGRTYYMLSPTLLGFFEFTFMRVNKDVPQKELAGLMWNYVHENRDVARSILTGETPLGRALVYEDAIDEEDRSQILTYDVASGLIREAKKIGVGLCYCRHIRGHVKDPCKYPMDVCTALNAGASYLIRRGFMREVSKEEALDSYIAEIDEKSCTGCGLCAKKCQVDLITLHEEGGKKYAHVIEDLCLGCGVCFDACRHGALKIRGRKERVLTPESTMEKYLMIAIEQGKLGNLLYDDFTSLPHTVLRNLVNAVTRIQPVKEYIAKEDVKSRFLKMIAAK
jgi:ferredoxin